MIYLLTLRNSFPYWALCDGARLARPCRATNTRPAYRCLDRVHEGGRLILPLTTQGFREAIASGTAAARTFWRAAFPAVDLPAEQCWLQAPG